MNSELELLLHTHKPDFHPVIKLKDAKDKIHPFNFTVTNTDITEELIADTGNFSKFKLLYNDTVQTTPLALLKQIDNKQYPVSFLNFKSIFPQYYIQGNDLLPKKKYPYYNLGELLMLAGIDSFYNDFLKNKFQDESCNACC